MRIDILTLFCDMCNSVLGESIIGRARQSGKVEINCIDIRNFTEDKHRRVDDKPYGGYGRMEHITCFAKRFDDVDYIELYLPARTAMVLKEGYVRERKAETEKK